MAEYTCCDCNAQADCEYTYEVPVWSGIYEDKILHLCELCFYTRAYYWIKNEGAMPWRRTYRETFAYGHINSSPHSPKLNFPHQLPPEEQKDFDEFCKTSTCDTDEFVVWYTEDTE